jgi:hypothetical protein
MATQLGRPDIEVRPLLPAPQIADLQLLCAFLHVDLPRLRITPQCHDSANGNPASRAGTRCVSKLSTAQLARKRANDREAQRAIRQRTKEHIENLERRIEELTDPSKDLKMMFDIQQRNRELEEEIRQLKEQMAQMTVQNTMNQLGQGDAMSGQWPILNMPFEQGGSGFLPDGGNGMLGVKLGTDAASGPSTASSLYTGADPNSPLYPEMGNSSGGFPDLNATTAAFPLTPGNPDNLGLRSDLTPRRYFLCFLGETNIQ